MSAQESTARPLALVTGATAGIGAEYARRLAERGHDLVLVARNEDRLRELAHDLSSRHGISVEVLRADLANAAQLAAVERRIEEGRALAMLVNNAGFGFGRPFLSVSADEHEAMIRVHVIAPTRLARAALPKMRDARSGAIVNVSSVAALSPVAGRVTYGATKTYLKFFSEALQLELEGTGIRVQALCPGFTRTEFHARASMELSLPNWLWMEPAQVVEASLEALETGSVVCVPGAPYKVLAAIARTVPAPVVAGIARRLAKYRSGRG